MPIEIRELVIKAKVNNKNTAPSRDSNFQRNEESLINEIVERVFKIIEQKLER